MSTGGFVCGGRAVGQATEERSAPMTTDIRSTSTRHDLIVELTAWRCRALAAVPPAFIGQLWEDEAGAALADAARVLATPSTAVPHRFAPQTREDAAERDRRRKCCVKLSLQLPEHGNPPPIGWAEDARAVLALVAGELFAELHAPRAASPIPPNGPGGELFQDAENVARHAIEVRLPRDVPESGRDNAWTAAERQAYIDSKW